MNFLEQYIKALDCLNSNKVDYMVVGGFAVNVHGFTRSTTDIDIWIDLKKDNLERLLKAFVELGYNKDNSIKAIEALSISHMIKIPLDNTKIELVDDFIVKSDFDKCYKNHITTKINGRDVRFIGFEDLIVCKENSIRMKDALDAKNLKELRKLRDGLS